MRVPPRPLVLGFLLHGHRRALLGCSAITGIFLLLGACATTRPTHYRNALHPEHGQVEFDRDVYECRRENTAPASSSYVYGYAGGSNASLVVNEAMALQCLRARGWQPFTSSTQPAPVSSTPAAGTWLCGTFWGGVRVPHDSKTTCLMVPPPFTKESEQSPRWRAAGYYPNMAYCEAARQRSFVTSADASARAALCVSADDPRLSSPEAPDKSGR